MSDAPETIGLIQDDFLDGIWAIAHKSEAKRATLYRRADLPPTDEECLRNEKVTALVEAASDLALVIDFLLQRLTNNGEYTYEDDFMAEAQAIGDYYAALADIQEMKP